jgi:hypothetical protein
MFVSYKPNRYIKDGFHYFEYEITDSEFGTVSGNGVGLMIVTAVIQEYSKRNLNVAANLALAFVWWLEQNPSWSIQQIINGSKIYNPPFSQYEKDLQKYLVLL